MKQSKAIDVWVCECPNCKTKVYDMKETIEICPVCGEYLGNEDWDNSEITVYLDWDGATEIEAEWDLGWKIKAREGINE